MLLFIVIILFLFSYLFVQHCIVDLWYTIDVVKEVMNEIFQRREVIRMKEKILKFIDDTIEVVEKLIKLVFAISSLLAVIKILFL